MNECRSRDLVRTMISCLDLVKEHPSIWYHVDAAWAGVALACPEFHDRLKLDAINKYADSFATNFHKACTPGPARLSWRYALTDSPDSGVS